MKEHIKKILEKRPLPKAHSAEKERISLSAEISCILASLLMVVGIICVFYTEHFQKLLPILLGSIMMTLGIFDIIRGVKTGEYKKRETKLTSNGVVNLILGIVILYRQSDSYIIIGVIWGTLGLIKGSEELNKAICSMSEKSPFIKEMIGAVVELILGLLMLIEPIANLHHHIILLGLELIVTGWKHICRIRKTFRTSIQLK